MKKILSFILTVSALTTTNILISLEEELLVEAIQTSPSVISVTTMEIDVFNLINQNRMANLLPALNWSPQVAEQARNHSLSMASKLVPFGHTGADARFAYLRNVIPNLIRFGENVAYNRGFSNPVLTAVNGWLKSPGHYANIMGDFNLTGVGVAKNLMGEYYFTQIFVKTASPTFAAASTLDESSYDDEQEHIAKRTSHLSETPFIIEIDLID